MNVDDFRDDFSSSAFRTIDGARRIVGKFCEIEVLSMDKSKSSRVGQPPTYDIYLVRPDREAISNRKLNTLIRGIEALPEYSAANSPVIKHFDGEAYLQTSSESLAREVGFLAGIKRRRRVSDAARQASAARLAKIRRPKPRVHCTQCLHFSGANSMCAVGYTATGAPRQCAQFEDLPEFLR